MAALRCLLTAYLAAAVLVGANVEHFDHPHFPFVSSPVREAHARRHARSLATEPTMEERFTRKDLIATIGGIRVQFVWDLITNSTYDAAVCTKVGDSVEPCKVETDNCLGAKNAKCAYTCEQADVVTPEMIAVAKGHATWTADFLRESLLVQTLSTPLDVAKRSKRCYNWPKAYDYTHEKADLVVVMTMHKSQNGVAGYASCSDWTDDGRCTVGYFNWCPNQVDVKNKESPDVIQAERATFLHEVLHLLGCCSGTGFSKSVTGKTFTDKQYAPIAGKKTYSKKVRFLHSPKVLATARKQWDCPTLDGVPLEDVPLGAGVHWEARVLGPEVMSYGILSGEAYLSDLTLAYLEDSGHYIASRTYKTGNQFMAGNNRYLDNYTYASGGRFLAPSGSGWTKGSLTSIAEFFGLDSTMTNNSKPIRRSPGFLRWGRLAGCPFFQERAQDAWDWDHYLCKAAKSGGCTPDNRMSATCSLKRWGSGGGHINQPYSCTDPNCQQKTANDATDGGLPMDFRAFSGSDAATQGGYNDAMDYVPVKVGYWNCLDKKPSSTSSNKVAGNQSLDFSGVFNALATDLEQFGGQQYGGDSRCFPSTLREFGSVLSTSFQQYGLCYVSNCYKVDYLQIGVRGRSGGTDWYGCPKNGGKMFIPGFTGALTCPKPTTFCQHEDVTGVYYQETELWVAWVIMGLIVGVPMLFVMILCCCPALRKKLVIRTKLCCGFELDPDEQLMEERRLAQTRVGNLQDRQFSASNTQRRLAAISSRTLEAFKFKVDVMMRRRANNYTRVLFWINAIWIILGAALVMFAILGASGQADSTKNAAPFLIAASFIMSSVASLGCTGVETGRASLKLLLYFYINMFFLLFSILGIVAFFAFKDYFNARIETQWYTYRHYFPDEYQDKTQAEASDKLSDDLSGDGLIAICCVFAFMLFSIVAGSISSAMVLTFKNLMSNMFMVFNSCFLTAFAVGSMYFGVTVLKTRVIPDWYLVVQLLLTITLFLVIALGAAGEWKRSQKLLKTYQVLALGMSFLALVAGLGLLGAKSKIESFIADLNEDSVAHLADALDQSGTEDQLADYIVATIMLYGVALVAVSVLLVALSVLAVYILRLYKARRELLSDWAAESQRRERNGLPPLKAPTMSFVELNKRRRKSEARRSAGRPGNATRTARPVSGRGDIEIGDRRRYHSDDFPASPPTPQGAAVPTPQGGDAPPLAEWQEFESMDFPAPPSTPHPSAPVVPAHGPPAAPGGGAAIQTFSA